MKSFQVPIRLFNRPQGVVEAFISNKMIQAGFDLDQPYKVREDAKRRYYLYTQEDIQQFNSSAKVHDD